MVKKSRRNRPDKNASTEGWTKQFPYIPPNFITRDTRLNFLRRLADISGTPLPGMEGVFLFFNNSCRGNKVSTNTLTSSSVLLYIHRDQRTFRDGEPKMFTSTLHSSWALVYFNNLYVRRDSHSSGAVWESTSEDIKHHFTKNSWSIIESVNQLKTET